MIATVRIMKFGKSSFKNLGLLFTINSLAVMVRHSQAQNVFKSIKLITNNWEQ